jgi:peptidoglycan/LPS O-acetylase OafA/YrhL
MTNLPSAWEPLRGRLRRITSSGRYIPEVDGLRFVAITAVVLFHIGGYVSEKVSRDDTVTDTLLREVLQQGHYGVELFFVLSGFVLSLPFAAHHLGGGDVPTLRSYFVRRLTRLEVPYLLSLLVLFAAALWLGTPASELGPSLAAGALYQHGLIFGAPNLVSSVAWSLEIEVQFYLLVPALTLVFRAPRRARRAILVVAAVAGTLVAPHGGLGPRVSLSLVAYLHYFLVGFLLADLYLDDWDRTPEHSFVGDLVGLIAWLGIPPLLFAPNGLLIFPWALFIAVAASLRGRYLSALLSRPLFTLLGGMSYTIYLWHFAVISAVGRWTLPASPGGSFAADVGLQLVWMVPAILGVSVVLFVLVERPCMDPAWPSRLKRRLLPARRP